MGTIITPWRSQPPPGTPMLPGPLVVVLPAGGAVYNLGNRNKEPTGISNGAGILFKPGYYGYSVGSQAASTNVVRLHSVANATGTVWEQPTSGVTVMAYGMRFAATALNRPIFGNQTPNTSPFAGWALTDAESDFPKFEAAPGGSYASISSSVALVDLVPFVLVGTYDGATMRIYLNGVETGSTAATGTMAYPSDADRGPGLGNFWNYTSGDRSFQGEIYVAALWDRALPSVEVANLSRNPWGFLFAPRLKWPFISGGASAASIMRQMMSHHGG